MTGVRTNRQRLRWIRTIGGAGALISLYYLGHGFATLSVGSLDMPGPGVFPIIVGAIFLLASILMMFQARHIDPAEQIDIPVGANRSRVLKLAVIFLAYCLALPFSGFITGTFVFVGLAIKLMASMSWLRAALLAVIISILIYLVFGYALHVPLPRDWFFNYREWLS